MRLGVLGEYAFFPQWLGYVLTVDAFVAWRKGPALSGAKGSSLLTRSLREFVGLFVLSAPVWWIFEGLNNFVLNWHYLIVTDCSVWQIVLIASIDFSTVIPAVFETAELVTTFGFIERLRARRRVTISPRFLWGMMYAGALALAAVVLLPRYAFPLTWIWLGLILDPLNYLRGRASLLGQIARGDWRIIVALAVSVLVCAFFWEMWNFFAMPKWFYTVPFFDFLRIFEMPLLGYGGYIPFAWELYVLYHFVGGLLRRPGSALSLDVNTD